MKTGDTDGIEQDLAARGIILEKVNAEDLEELLQDYDPEEKIIH